ncbi:hypothetical protein [Burkholderia sp. SCN-KJ]|uniref:hypothetical protein n=1 Tax=Burkholderia sp. SCN-KJ TaxID=2969248 RepID=UPI0021500FA7|nr:hypothetical protein [Burkholderia sp. SCN-KJ]MCR4466532.1 hypothetical protein [Burkholderia sp. SCN-KJ]
MDEKELIRRILLASQKGPDMTRPQPDSSGYTPPALGTAHARLMGYYEMGKHPGKYKGQPRVNDEVWLAFELSGPNHPPRELDDGTRVPQRIMVKERFDLTATAHFFKLFGMMNYAGKATHMAQLLGEAYLVEVFHRKSTDGMCKYAYIRDSNGYTVRGPSYQDPINGKTVAVEVAPPLTEPRAFIWDIADLEMWNSIFVEGEYEAKKDDKGNVTQAARSKNVLQNYIKEALNWKEHPLAQIIEAGGAET